ncbi:MAG TPA: tetratricopeptide repeat protein [Armatimonadota bacterium]|nr:tetratricopeptide repeat protein [Armatimonadota bacterium]
MKPESLWRRRLLLLGGVLIAAMIIATIGCLYWIWWPRQKTAALVRRESRIAEAASRTGNLDLAESAWMAVLAARPNDANAYSHLGDLYLKASQPDVAITAFLQLARVDPRYPYIYSRLAEASDQRGDDHTAYAYAEHELKLDPDCPQALDFAARMEGTGGDHARARRDALHAYRVAPDNEQVVLTYADQFMDADPDGLALKLIKARKTFPRSAQIAYDLGWCYAHAAGSIASIPKAMEEFRAAEVLGPGNAPPHHDLSSFLLAQGKAAEAAREGSLAVQDAPRDPQNYLVYAQALQRLGRQAEANAALAKFQKLNTAYDQRGHVRDNYVRNLGNPAIAHRLALLDEELGEDHEALIVLRLAVDRHPHNQQVANDLLHLTGLASSL